MDGGRARSGEAPKKSAVLLKQPALWLNLLEFHSIRAIEISLTEL